MISSNIINIILTHLYEVLPFYLLFELINYAARKYLDFNTLYFILHFLVNLINSILLFPVIIHLTNDPLYDIVPENVSRNDFTSLDYIYPMVIGLHVLHLVHNIRQVNSDELIHHVITHLFWYGIYYCNSSKLYIAPMIVMSGIPGGITYLMLALQKFGKIKKITEKKISMYLNVWIRAPVCIIFSALMYVKNMDEYNYDDKSLYSYYFTMFMIFFTFINGVHFMNNIIYSYYENYFKGS